MNDMEKLLWLSVEKGASDIFIGVGRRVSMKIDGIIVPQCNNPISENESEKLMTELYELANRPVNKFMLSGDDDFAAAIPGLARFRVSAYRQRGTFAAVIRVVRFDIPDYSDINIPDEVMKIADERNGLVLVAGPAGSGKTTTLACVIDAVNKKRNCHIITLEDPIEYLHKDDKSLISQREIGIDSDSYISALKTCLRQAPDIILPGEMRDHETIKTAMTAAETGHLVISTLHTSGAVNTIDRIIDVFPPAQQQQVRIQLSMLLKTVVSQQLLPTKGGSLIPAFEIMHANSAIRSLLREQKTHQIDGVIQTSSADGMISMDDSIFKLYLDGVISKETALNFAVRPERLMGKMEA